MDFDSTSLFNIFFSIIFIAIAGSFAAYRAGQIGYSRFKWFLASFFGNILAVMYILSELPNRMLDIKREKQRKLLQWKLEKQKEFIRNSKEKIPEDTIGDKDTIHSFESAIVKPGKKQISDIVSGLNYFQAMDDSESKSMPFTISEDEKLSKFNYFQIVIFVIIGMLSSVRLSFEYFSTDLTPLQIFISFILGYRFGRKVGLISGFLIFLPNYISYLFLYIFLYITENHELSLREKIFGGYYCFDFISIYMHSLIFYLLHSMLGFFSGVLRKAIPILADRYAFVTLRRKTSPDWIFFTLPLLFFFFSYRFNDFFRINFSVFFEPLLLLFSFYYGFQAALTLFLFSLPLIILNISPIPDLHLGISYSYYQIGMFWYLSTLLLSGFLDTNYRKNDEKAATIIFYPLLIISLALCFYIYPVFEKYSFKSYPFIFSLLLLSGYLLGPQKGFLFGVLVDIFPFIYVKPFENINFFTGYLFQIAPIIGYLGGTKYFKKKTYFRNGFKLGTIICGIAFIDLLYDGSINWGYYLYPLIYFFQTIVSMLVFYPLMFIKKYKSQSNPYPVSIDNPFTAIRYFKIIMLTITGMFCCFALYLPSGKLSFAEIQILIAFIIGYRYGKKTGLISGLLIFFPNFLIYIDLYFKIDEISLKSMIFGGNNEIDILIFYALSPLTYGLYSIIGLLSAITKETIFKLSERYDFIDLHEKKSSKKIYFTLLLFLFCINCYFSKTIQINISILFKSVVLLISFYYGFRSALKILLFSIPIIILDIRPLDKLIFGLDFGTADFFWYLSASLIIGYLRIANHKSEEKNKNDLFILLFFISLSLAFVIYPLWEYYSFRAYYLTFPLFLIAGYLLGPEKGFIFGLLLGILTCISIKTDDYYHFFSLGFLYDIAPLLGYLGGTVCFEKRYFIKNAFIISGIIYGITFFIRLCYGDMHLGTYLYSFIYMAQSVLALFFFYPLLFLKSKAGNYPIFHSDSSAINLQSIENFNKQFPSFSISDDAFITKWHIQIVILTIIGIISCCSIRVSNWTLQLNLLQIIIVFFLGYRFGKMVGLGSGIVIFFPNLISYFMQKTNGYPVYIDDVFYIPPFNLISYCMYSISGFLSGLLRISIPIISNNNNFIQIENKREFSKIYFVLPLFLIGAMSFNFGNFSIHFDVFFTSSLLVISFYYGFRKALQLLFFAMPVILVQGEFSEIVKFGMNFDNIYFFWYLSALLFIGFLKPKYNQSEEKNHIAIFFILLLVCLLFTFYIFSIWDIHTFYSYYFIIPIILIAGYLFGSDKGFLFGILLGLFSFISIKFVGTIQFVNMGFLYATAPIIGYLGGTPYFARPLFFKNGLVFAAIICNLILFARLYYGYMPVSKNLYPFIFLIQMTISSIIFYPIFIIVNRSKTIVDNSGTINTDRT